MMLGALAVVVGNKLVALPHFIVVVPPQDKPPTI